jgi:hypothetical protein
MVMFTEAEVLRLKNLSVVSRPSLVWFGRFYNAVQSELEPGDLKAHYNSYLAGGHISVYNPLSIMCAFEQSTIKSY